MTQIWDFVMAHQTTVALIAYWIGSNFISALPSPSNTSGGFYKFFFALLHGLAGSIPRVLPGARVFNDPTQGSQTYFAKPAEPPASK